MTKRNPAYESGWHSTGTMKVLPSVEQVARRLEENPDVILHAMQPKRLDGWWSYDAVWMVGDVRVRGRLNIHNQHPDDPKDPAKDALDPRTYDPEATPLDGYFHVFAEADQPWQAEWPSPLGVFLDRKLKPSYVTMDYSGHNPLHTRSSSNLGALFSTLAELPWLATVLIHDEIDIDDIMPQTGAVMYDVPLVSRLPSSLYGRVLDVRILGETTFIRTNALLKKYGTNLPRGGAAILLSTSRRKGIGKADLSFPMVDRPFSKGGDITNLAASLSRLLGKQVMSTDADAIDELRKEWTLLTDAERSREEAALMVSAADRIEELEERVVTLRGALKLSQELNDKLKAGGDALLEEARKAIAREREAIDQQGKLQSELDRLLRVVRDSDLGEAIRAREAAEDEVEVAEELLDEQNHELTELRQENARLRRELARLGSTFSSAPTSIVEEVPDNWEDFFSRASNLEHVVLGKVDGEVDKLRGQTQERTWIHRSWEALLALEEYAQLKKERGTEEVPHFSAYLLDPSAEHVIPRTRYTGVESKGVMMNSRFVAARTLPVPRQVDPSGKIVMEAHIRIGSGKPPAPRMHFHDDTSGSTGKIYVGHLGPHLPNYQTN